jgi:hypothetical protein
MKARILLAMAAAAAFAAPLAAQTSAGSDKDRSAAGRGKASSAALFDRLDKNKDGFVTRDEARDATELQGRFAELDVDNDGKISRGEMRALDGQGAAGSNAQSSSASRGRDVANPNPAGGSTGGVGGSTGPAGSSSGPNPAGEAPKSGVSK